MKSLVDTIGFATVRYWAGRMTFVGLLLLGMMSGALATAQESYEDSEQATTLTAPTEEEVERDVEAGAGETAAGETDAGEEKAPNGSAFAEFATLALVLAVFIGPIIVGRFLSNSFRMPDHGWKFTVAIGTLVAAAVIYYKGELKFGPDLSGGSTIIFELDHAAVNLEGKTRAEIDELIDRTITALAKRVDPSGTKEVTIRKYGDQQIEIIIPRVGKDDLAYIERNIYTAGILEFRITASPVFREHEAIIDKAKKLPPGIKSLHEDGEEIARWMPYNLDEFGPVEDESDGLVKRMVGQIPHALVLYDDGLNVIGKHLDSAKSSIDRNGRPSVSFEFNARGSSLFGQLTGRHTPNASGRKYHLGIVLDNNLISAPTINERIRSKGEISGNMGQDGVDFIVDILRAGSLPTQLSKEPISRETISPTLGAETVVKGKQAILYSLAAVMVFMLIYYRFAGLVACLALASNLLLILGLMVLLKAAFTLPGLAGLVLTIGMSVDANVLIFERIREERKRGAALRMAIRNGFGRATQTIVDANVTTLITAMVIYKIAPDNVKGFGVTLIIGILMSMYSAIFLSRIVFDVAEKARGIKELGMTQIVGKTNINFLGKRLITSIISMAIIGVGLAAVADRGSDLLNIDFTGGSSVQMVLKEDQKMAFSEVKDLLDQQPELAEKNLSLVEVEKSNTRYTVSCVEQNVTRLQEILAETFGESLETYRIETSDIQALSDATSAYRIPTPGPRVEALLSATPDQRDQKAQVTLVNFQEDAESQDTESQDAVSEDSGTNTGSAEDAVSEESVEEEAGSNALAEEMENEESSSTNYADPFVGGTSAQVKFQIGSVEKKKKVLIGYDAVVQLVQDALEATNHGDVAQEVSHPDYVYGSALRLPQWQVKLALAEDQAREVFSHLEMAASNQPVFPLANKIGGRVAGDMKTKAIAAIVISLLGIVAYIWFRFQRVVYGLAAVVALVHDVLVTLGMIALSAYVVNSIPGLSNALLIEKFQISLPIVAAFLTIIGYSLNDTIVVFDRIREVKGKSPNLTRDIINTSINQTLARTLLTSLTTLLSVILLYVLGGDGIHGFAFSLVIGVVVGTYSSIFIASPTLLWMSNRQQGAANKPA